VLATAITVLSIKKKAWYSCIYLVKKMTPQGKGKLMIKWKFYGSNFDQLENLKHKWVN
jgi:hypothetical protein